ncbi:PaaI family thioesterase [Sphingomonas qomolangmaensis]|uniref:PaaI family thioesterase n=1 Tax=Sphingomonas qomolangmaensis TaxID=2918765 RepID=A0ABY5L8C0_9SPHN|nr:PaaI family thioesterase [Sphingomonas qomolangmaensis]UUL82097.1 PaaI family thioesterase [Sphingomonas qomolangmaensis]
MTLPPYAQLLGIVAERDAGAPTELVMPFTPEVLGRPGFVHGGALGGLLEMAAIVALTEALGADAARVKPINVTVDFMRGGREKPTRAAGTVTRLGTRIANVEAVAWQDSRDKPIAAARMLYLLVR